MQTLVLPFGALLAAACLCAGPVTAQTRVPALSGTVLDGTGAPLPGVRVTILELGRVNVTTADGVFRFSDLAPATYTLSLSRLGLAPETRRVSLGAGGERVEVRMREARTQLAAVQVTATLAATAAQASPQPTAVLEGPELRVAQGAALGETLEQVPGVRSLSMTTGIGKPVIRGMTHYRVVTLDNGQRTETQAWGHDHSPNVETANAERVEVIKGPASVLYGSDALGGVVNVVAPPVPDALDVPAFVRGRLSSAYSHNIRGGDGTVMLEGAREGFGARAAVTVRGSGDMRTPAGVLRNTTNAATAVEAATGFRAAWGSVSARYAGRAERIGIFDDPAQSPEYTGYQDIGTHRGMVDAGTVTRAGRLQLNAGWEQNFRREYADAHATEADLGLFVRSWNGSAQLHHAPVGAFTGTVGASVMRSDFENRGTETLIPGSGTRNAAVYLVEQAEYGRWRTTYGARYDHRTLATAGNVEIGVPAQRRVYSAVTGSVGASYRVAEPLALVATVARGFRAPAAPDLFANGFHEGTRAFERGSPDLRVETSLNTELGLRVTRPTLAGELTGFLNRVDDYIYLRPFGSGGRAFDSLQVVQGDARLAGIEGRVAYHPSEVLTLHASGDYVRGQNTTAGVPLTFIPPARVVYGARVGSRRLKGAVRNPYVTLTAESNARQTRIDPSDVSTPGYTLASVGGGFTRLLPRGAVTVDMQVRNLFDVAYRSFMSRYKEFALGPGRSMVVKVGTSF